MTEPSECGTGTFPGDIPSLPWPDQRLGIGVRDRVRGQGLDNPNPLGLLCLLFCCVGPDHGRVSPSHSLFSLSPQVPSTPLEPVTATVHSPAQEPVTRPAVPAENLPRAPCTAPELGPPRTQSSSVDATGPDVAGTGRWWRRQELDTAGVTAMRSGPLGHGGFPPMSSECCVHVASLHRAGRAGGIWSLRFRAGREVLAVSLSAEGCHGFAGRGLFRVSSSCLGAGLWQQDLLRSPSVCPQFHLCRTTESFRILSVLGPQP